MNNFAHLQVGEKEKSKLLVRASKYTAFCGIAFNVLHYKNKVATIQATQIREINGFILTKKQLIARCLEFFTEYDFKIKVIPETYKPNFDFITGEWVKSKMLEYDLKASDLINQFGVDKSTMSQMLNGVTKISKVAKVGFYYYFLVYELNKQFREQ